MSVKIALLGEVTAHVDQRPVNLGTPRQRCVLAALAVDAGRLVPAERLVARVWGTDTPRRGRATLQTHISRLRGVFGDALVIVHRSDGYTLEMTQPEQVVDLLQFRALCDQARDAGEDARTVALLTEALALWSEDPLTGLSGKWVEGERDRWQQERSAAEHDLVDAQLSIGLGDELVAPLSARVVRYPLDERVAGQYMLALHRAGRSADALDHYRQLRERLVEQLGTDPGIALQDLHQQILQGVPILLSTPVAVVPKPVALPRQLPAAPPSFVGRRDELDRLDAISSTVVTSSAAATAGAMVLISAIGGVGGIGKTWLALRWAHHNMHRFPDGQLFVDLHGFSPTGRPAHPTDVLGGFLEALGVGRDRQPTDPDRRAELYRSLVADKRMLVVLDNVATTDQVTPLLPGGQHCTVVMTSRNQLRGLIARHGARPVRLDVLTDAEAHALLTTCLGPDRVADDEPAVAKLIELCGGFPLALSLIAARVAAEPRLPLEDAVAELRAMGLSALESEDPTASLPTVLSWSLDHLTAQQCQAFALLSIAPGPDISLPAAVRLTGLPERETHAVLRALAEASLIDRIPGNRYGLHDLVRAYATTLADNLPVSVREEALRRVLDFYVHTSHIAARLLYRHRDPVWLDPPVLIPHRQPHPLLDAPAAWSWFDAEYACLMAAQRIAIAHHWHAATWHLAWSLYTFHYRRGRHHDQIDTWRAGADAAAQLPDPVFRIIAHHNLGLTHAHLGDYDNASKKLHQALALAEQHHDLSQQAHVHRGFAFFWEMYGDNERALEHAQRALELFGKVDEPAAQAQTLNAVGWYAAQLGDYETARSYCLAALDEHLRQNDLTSEGPTQDSLGYIEHHTGHYAQAIQYYRRALDLFRQHSNLSGMVGTLDALGHSHVALSQTEQARTVWKEALELYQQQGRHDDAVRVQRQLVSCAANHVDQRG